MIIDLQRRLAEVGRIRIGQQITASNGKSRPAKLDTFRLTSPDRRRIHEAAKLYGGTPQEWQAPAGKQWELVTEVDHLNVVVPPSDMAFTQFYELWSAGGCQRRCDGQHCTFNDSSNMVEGECLCDPDARECSIHSRLSVMLRELPGLGVWRLDTQGYYAAVELQGSVEVVRLAAGHGQMLPAVLRLEQRMVKRGGQTRRFAVPVLDIDISPAQLLAGRDSRDAGTIAIDPTPPQGPLTPVPDTVPERPAASVAEQALTTPPRRKGRQQPIPATGLAPRTRAQVATLDVAGSREAAPPTAAASQQDDSPQPSAENRDPVTPQDFSEPIHPYDAAGHGLFSERGFGDGPCGNRYNDNITCTQPPGHEGDHHATTRSADYTWDDTGHINTALVHASYTPEPNQETLPLVTEDVRLITEPQLKKLSILLREAGFTDRDTRHDFVAAAIGRGITTAKELSRDEASRVIDLLENGPPPTEM